MLLQGHCGESTRACQKGAGGEGEALRVGRRVAIDYSCLDLYEEVLG